MKNLLYWLLLLPALLLLLLSLGVTALVLSTVPPGVAVAAWVVIGLVGLWFVFRRRSGASVPSEHSMLRQSSKEGLL